MSNENQVAQEDQVDALFAEPVETLVMVDELTELKDRANFMGLKFHPSISLEKLREKVNAAVTTKGAPSADVDEDVAENKPVNMDTKLDPRAVELQRRIALRKDAMKLVRIRLQCMNPAKKEWNGEIITVGNAGVGTIRKFVPFNAFEDGWHVENFIYQVLKDRECQVFVNDKSARGVTVRKGKMIKEFVIEVLPPLTDAERHDLAQRQAMSGQAA